MNLDYPDRNAIDSTCGRRVPEAGTQVGGSGETLPARCGEEAVTWFDREGGTRLYVCPDHAKEVLRFQEGDDDLPEDWNELQRYASEQGINPKGFNHSELRARLRYLKDASDLPPHPRVSPCRSCHKLTLEDELDWTERRCPACRDEQEEIDPDRVVEASRT